MARESDAHELTATVTALEPHPDGPTPGGSVRPAQLAAGEWIAGRYRVEALIGRGGHGEVYRVLDARAEDTPLALKLHRVRSLSRTAVDALEGEFALLASLSHPNLAPVHDFTYVEGEYALFTQRLVDGKPLHHAGVDPLDRVGVTLLAQLCRALDYLHVRGIVHGDIKPGNILVDATHSHLTLLDFGVSRALVPASEAEFGASVSDGGERARAPRGFAPSVERRVVGSPPYMAPELIASGHADVRTDLYALGVTLYQLAAGRLPFGGSQDEVLRAHLEQEVPPLPPHVPLPYATLVARLLAKEPGARPKTALAVLDDLARMARVQLPVDTSETLASHVLSARFVGRERELGWLTARSVDPGREPVPVAVVGEPGSGKSRLLREVRVRAQLRGRQWIQVRAQRPSGGPHLLAQVARAVLRGAALGDIEEEERLALARALPELRRPHERLAFPLDPDRARERRLGILANLIAERFRWRAGTLAIEDLHWSTEAEQRDLGRLLEAVQQRTDRCFVLLGSRPEGLSRQVMRKLSARRLRLDELSADASRELVETMFGDPRLLDGSELGAALERGTSSALWLQESLRLALEDGAVERHGEVFARTAPIPNRPLREVLEARVRGLSRDGRSLALGAAVLAGNAAAAELARVAGLARPRAARALTELSASGLVARELGDGGRPRWAMHDRYVDAVLGVMPERRVKAARRRAGRWMAQQHGGDFRVLSRAALELEAAGDRSRATTALARGAELAERVGRLTDAVSMLERETALREEGDPSRFSSLLRLYDLAVRAGQGDSAGRALMELAAIAVRDADETRLFDVALRGARQALRDGDVDAARRHADSVLAPDAPLETERACAMAILRGEVARAEGRADAALARFEPAAASARRLGASELAASAELEAALVYVRRGDSALATESATRAVADAKANKGARSVLSQALRMLGNAHFIGGRRARALTQYRRAVKVARQSGATESEAKALNNAATCAHALGQVDESIAAWQRAVVLKARVGAEASALLTWASMSGVLTIFGEGDEARFAQQRAIESPRLDARPAAALAWSNRGDLEVLEGDLDAAIEAYRAGAAGYAAIDMAQLRAHALAGLIRARLARDGAGALERGTEALGELEALVEAGSAPEDERRLWTSRALLREVSGDTDGALADARRAARRKRPDTCYEDVFGSSLDACWTLACLLHRAGRATERAVSSAQALFERRLRVLGPDGQRAFSTVHPLHVAIAAGRLVETPGRTF